jgi:hypothetical protein
MNTKDIAKAHSDITTGAQALGFRPIAIFMIATSY